MLGQCSKPKASRSTKETYRTLHGLALRAFYPIRLKELVRQYHCDACGIAIDRDQNAAINIKRLGTSLATDKTVSEAHDFSHG
jgi:hypothetical protein